MLAVRLTRCSSFPVWGTADRDIGRRCGRTPIRVYRRVLQQDWDDPDLAEWARAVDRAVRESHLPCLLVAHSFGCLVVAQRALHCGDGIAGALLVAPADPDRRHVARGAIVGRAFGFPSIVVASETDPWLDIDKARDFAAQWGSRFVNAGAAGHINVDAGFGPWPDGERLLGALHAAAVPCALASAV